MPVNQWEYNEDVRQRCGPDVPPIPGWLRTLAKNAQVWPAPPFARRGCNACSSGHRVVDRERCTEAQSRGKALMHVWGARGAFWRRRAPFATCPQLRRSRSSRRRLPHARSCWLSTGGARPQGWRRRWRARRKRNGCVECAAECLRGFCWVYIYFLVPGILQNPTGLQSCPYCGGLAFCTGE